MDWRIKAGMHWAFSTLPFGTEINYLMQRRVTRSLPVSAEARASIAAMAKRHFDAASAHQCAPLADQVWFEFGAGWDMNAPLALWALGVRHQVLVDLFPLLQAELVQDTLSAHGRRRRLTSRRAAIDAMRAEYGIDYRAPADARSTGLPSGSVNVITSTSTLEHIGAHDIPAVLQECYRLLRPGGVMTSHIAYDDHYAATDRRITRHNFLQYSDREWRRWSPPTHYQNRLRHSDYIRLFEAVGLRTISVETQGPTDRERAWLDAHAVDRRFDGYCREDLAITHGFFVLQKP